MNIDSFKNFLIGLYLIIIIEMLLILKKVFYKKNIKKT